MNEAPQTSVMLFSCSYWVGKLFMCFNLRMTSVHRSERETERRDLGVCCSWMIFYTRNVTVQRKHLFSWIIWILQTSKYSGCSGWDHSKLMHKKQEATCPLDKRVSKSEKGGVVPLRQRINTWADTGTCVSHPETSSPSQSLPRLQAKRVKDWRDITVVGVQWWHSASEAKEQSENSSIIEDAGSRAWLICACALQVQYVCFNSQEHGSASSLLSVLVCSFFFISSTVIMSHQLMFVERLMQHQSVLSAHYKTEEYLHTHSTNSSA